MKLEQRSQKSKEKFADGLMSISNSVVAAALIGVFVVPLTAFISSVFAGTEPFSPLAILGRMTWPNIGVFAVVYLLPIAMSVYARDKAMDLYDEVHGMEPSASRGKPQTA